MLEDAATVEKAVTSLAALADKTDAQSQNQKVRWIQNKEIHAQRVIESISNYFLTQRVKPGQDDYPTRLARHHAVILAAMKAKQKTDADSAQVLRESIQALRAYYPSPVHQH
jgi:nickel superoxide dismutase